MATAADGNAALAWLGLFMGLAMLPTALGVLATVLALVQAQAGQSLWPADVPRAADMAGAADQASRRFS